MAKRTASAAKAAKSQPTKTTEPATVTPQRVHELLGLPARYDPPKPPPDSPGYLTAWDPAASILEIRKRHWGQFYYTDWYERTDFAKAIDQAKWRQYRLAPVLPGEPFDKQFAKLPSGDAVASARELVSLLVVHFLATGERIPVRNLRCRDRLPSGRRVMLGFSDFGFSLGSCADEYTTPWLGLAAVHTPAPTRR